MQVIATPYAVTFRHIDCAAATHAVSGLPWHCVWCDARLPGWQCMQACCPGPCPAWAAFPLCCLPASFNCASDVQLNSGHLATINSCHTSRLVTASKLDLGCSCVHCQRAGSIIVSNCLKQVRSLLMLNTCFLGTGKAPKRVWSVPALCSGLSTCPCELH